MNDEQLTITTAEREAMRADAKEIAREGCVYHSTPVVLALQVLRLLAALAAATERYRLERGDRLALETEKIVLRSELAAVTERLREVERERDAAVFWIYEDTSMMLVQKEEAVRMISEQLRLMAAAAAPGTVGAEGREGGEG